MAADIRLEIDGREFPFPDLDTITFKEGKVIKNATGLRIGELNDAFKAGDSDAILAVIIIAKLRADGAVDIEALQDRKITELLKVIEPEGPAEEAAAEGPLAEAVALPDPEEPTS